MAAGPDVLGAESLVTGLSASRVKKTSPSAPHCLDTAARFQPAKRAHLAAINDRYRLKSCEPRP